MVIEAPVEVVLGVEVESHSLIVICVIWDSLEKKFCIENVLVI